MNFNEFNAYQQDKISICKQENANGDAEHKNLIDDHNLDPISKLDLASRRRTSCLMGKNALVIPNTSTEKKTSVNMNVNMIDEEKQPIKDNITQDNNNQNQIAINDNALEVISSESKISKIITESIVKKIILLILALLFILPLCDVGFWNNESTDHYNILANYLGSFNSYNLLYNKSNNSINISHIIEEKLMNWMTNENDPIAPIINITINDIPYYVNKSEGYRTFRQSEIKTIVSSDGLTTVIYDNTIDVYLSSITSIVKTIYLCFVLTAAAVILEDDTKKLVLEPLEIMIEIVDNVAKDPINAKNVEDIQNAGIKALLAETKMSEEEKKKQQEKVQKYEVKIIQNAILKISALLAIGFGEAGGEIIKKNLGGSSELQAMVKGKKKMAIFGFCDIRNFQIILDALQEKTMVFVNEIADIVHSSVDRYGGAANKNIGDAFLCAWKFTQALEDKNKNEKENDKNIKKKERDELHIDFDNPKIKMVADQALMGFLKVLIKVNREQHILDYRKNEKINETLHNFKVNMGFGLHMGYAIEGAIGSQYKIDASYLSPNVNMASRLEAATRQYGVSILISGELYDKLSLEIQGICRLIDVVKVKGSKLPVRLYTVDVNLDLAPKDKKKKNNAKLSDKRKSYEEKRNKVLRGIEQFNSVGDYVSELESFKELLTINRPIDFVDVFNEACSNYLEGNWDAAKEGLQKCLIKDPNDGPTKTLLNFMKETGYKLPPNWEKCRELKSK